MGSGYNPYRFQKKAIDSIFKSFNKKFFRPLIVAPTGSGKSVIIACFCEQILTQWNQTRILIISDTTEIIKQDYETIAKQLPDIEIGIFSTSLKKKMVNQITIASIQTIYKESMLFSKFHIVVVDEAQKVSFDLKTRYRSFLDKMDKPTIGLTATPFRMRGGYLYTGENAFFNSIAFKIDIYTLQKEGVLCEIKTKGSKYRMDTKGIKKQNGDFSAKQLAIAFDRDRITKKICLDLLQFKNSRKKWLGFAIDLKHCEHIAKELNYLGIKTRTLHSKVKKRNEIIRDYKNGNFQALISVDMITTGFNVKDIDLIVCLRPTASPALNIQMIGRGLRSFLGKTNCLVKDYAGNLFRNGTLDNPNVNDRGLKRKSGELVLKECSVCLEIVPIAVLECPECKTKFKFRHNLTDTPKEAPILTVKVWHKVDSVSYSTQRSKKNGMNMLKVDYFCGFRSFTEFIFFDHPPYWSKLKAARWWGLRTHKKVPKNSNEAEEASHYLIKPTKILIEEKTFPKIKDYVLKGVKQT